MKSVVGLLTATVAFLAGPALGDEPPRGTFLELHSCELYAGGCVVSSEATQGGRYMLRAWHFTGGSFGATSLAGLSVALLQDSQENLAARDALPGQSVLYLPAAATPAQRAALVTWVRSEQARPFAKPAVTRVVAMTWAADAQQVQFSAGDFISVTAASMASCASGSCGEALWYTPRTENSLFTVAVNRASRVSEPALKLRWEDAGKRSVFLAKYGPDAPSSNLYVSLMDLCGPSGALF